MRPQQIQGCWQSIARQVEREEPMQHDPDLPRHCAGMGPGNESGLLIGNVIGSNMFNLFMVMGLTGIIFPFSLSKDLLHRDLPVMIAFTLALVAILGHTKGTKKWHGVLFFGTYCIYCFSLL